MKKKFIAVILAIFAGGFGAHKFYLRQPELGIAYIALFIWLGRFFGFHISTFLGWYDAYKLLTMDELEFDRKYNSYYFRDRFGRRLDKAYKPYNKRRARYILLDGEENPIKRARETYLKPSNNLKESEQFKQSGIRKFKEFDTKGAIEEFKKALLILPDDKALHFNIACAYSIEEKPSESFFHLDKAVANGFKDIDKILTHESLAFIRVMPEFELFQDNHYRVTKELLANIKKMESKEILDLNQKIPITLHNEKI